VGGPADTAFPASKHHVADPEDFLGYLNAYQYKDHLDPSGTTVVKGTLEEIEADLKRLSEGGLTLTAAKDVEVYGLSGQALPWSTPAQYFLAKGQTPPWVRDSGPVPEDEDEEVLTEEGQGRIEVNVPPEGAEYVNRAVKTNPFLADMIALFGNNHACSLEQIRSVFEQYSTEYVCQKMPESADFDYVLYFEDPQIDAYYYCVKKEMEHTIYHRFTQKDYEALLD